jgi:hypothetical protein
VPDPKQEGVRWFAPTGHTLRGAFLDYWTRYGGLEQFGYPLTEEFYEPVGEDNKQYRVQYFERNRFEHHPENAGTPYEVLLGTLGRDFRQQDPPAQPLPAPAVYFRETGHNLSGVFKEYWDTHGGLFVHGFPITEAVMERSTDGKEYLVQWFERSRFELHRENRPPHNVLLGLLGRQLSEKKGYPFGWYPLYGYAGDYSWFAGYFRQDPLRCGPCGCRTVSFVHPSTVIHFASNRLEVQPYGPEWTRILEETRLEASVEPESGTQIVVFGQLDDSDSIAKGEITPSCLSPKFKVTKLQFNPAR